MWFSRKQVEKDGNGGVVRTGTPALPEELAPAPAAATKVAKKTTTKRRGDVAEAVARQHLIRHGLALVENNYRTPGRGGGEIDLVMRDRDGTLVFVEVRQRSGETHGGAGASISPAKQRRIIFAAQLYIMKFASPPPCRFDVVLVQGEGAGVRLEWLKAAFDASA
ncbi:MAG: YraN family protein [Comamonadaceae bacterium]|nr:MAG: YraN family protein [Comamonadaceae bacterium]